MFGYSEDMVIPSVANRSIPGTSHLWKTFCRTEFLTGHLCEPRLLAGAAEVPWAAEPRPELQCLLTERGRAPSPVSADKLHSCGVTCQHLQRGSPETNQECSACQTVALSHYIETTFLREPWALSEHEWGIHWHSDLQPCNHVAVWCSEASSTVIRTEVLQKCAKCM